MEPRRCGTVTSDRRCRGSEASNDFPLPDDVRRRLHGKAQGKIRSERIMAPPPVIRLHPDDNVVIARATLLPGAPVADDVAAAERIPAGHKVAVRPIAQARRSAAMARSSASPSAAIAPGQHVHVHNCEMGDFAKDYAYGVDAQPTEYFESARDVSGHPPARRKVATRNYIGILTSVNCSRACRRAGRRHVPAQPVHRRRSAGGLSQRRWRRRADPQDRLRHDPGRAAAPAAPHAGAATRGTRISPTSSCWGWAAR